MRRQEPSWNERGGPKENGEQKGGGGGGGGWGGGGLGGGAGVVVVVCGCVCFVVCGGCGVMVVGLLVCGGVPCKRKPSA